MVAAQNVIPLETDPQPVPSKAILYAKLARVMGKVERVAKSGSNPNLGYRFATAPDVYDTIRTALAEENVAFFPTMLEVKPEIVTTTKEYGGKTETKQTKRIHITFEFTFACGDTGAVKTCIWESEADDNQGKGIGSAATYAIKYFLIGTFLISTGDVDDADSDAPADEKPAKPQRRVDTSKGAPPPPAAEPNGKAEPLFQHLMAHVKHPRYQDSKARANAINKLLLADLLPDGERAALVKRVEHYATLRDDGKDENAAMLEIRKELQGK